MPMAIKAGKLIVAIELKSIGYGGEESKVGFGLLQVV